jgi:hypothetical protein
VGALWKNGEYFVTSPNTHYIPLPLEASSVTLRADGHYAEDDYLLWPQPWNENYCHLSVIRKKPQATEDDPNWFMWQPFDHREFHWSDRESCVGGIGRLRKETAEQIAICIDRLKKETMDEELHRKLGLPTSTLDLLNTYRLRMESTFTRFRGRPCSEEEANRGWVEVQRTWHSLHALWAYLTVYRERMRGRQTPAVYSTEDPPFMGAFTNDEHVAQLLHLAGIPVWLIRKISSFTSQNILALTEMRHPQVCRSLPSNRNLVLFSGHPGWTQKFRAIEDATHQFCLHPDPFELASDLLAKGSSAPAGRIVPSHAGPVRFAQPSGSSRRACRDPKSKATPYPKGRGKNGGKTCKTFHSFLSAFQMN